MRVGNRRRWFIKSLSFVLVFALGATLGEMLDWGYFELSRQISVIESLTLIATLGCALYITRVLEKQLQDVRVEKELHMSEISELSALLHSIDTMFEDSAISYKRIEGRIHACIRRSIGIFVSIRSSFPRDAISEINEFEVQVTDGIRQLRSLLTRTTIESGSSADTIDFPSVYVNSDEVTYSSERISEINALTDVIVGSLFRLKVRINHL